MADLPPVPTTIAAGIPPRADAWARAYAAGYTAGFEDGRVAGLPARGRLPDAILAVVSDGREWTVEQIKATRDQLPAATQKQIYNALAYLTRRGYVARLGYGRYVVSAKGRADQRQQSLFKEGET
jgi:hypothetical protein